ncbi:hypothetical protein CEXT_485771 [Caerostris extrusa]|uniref:Uncharacterized protein n=1 Tax=Caerostris extrusa TaxID=172846 RepID=A0AAV4WLZ7_CAEEX|nr:hypothetical protein CEXT_485771 [Caerostris extrusa]
MVLGATLSPNAWDSEPTVNASLISREERKSDIESTNNITIDVEQTDFYFNYTGYQKDPLSRTFRRNFTVNVMITFSFCIAWNRV